MHDGMKMKVQFDVILLHHRCENVNSRSIRLEISEILLMQNINACDDV
jgi:hypothetical protein